MNDTHYSRIDELTEKQMEAFSKELSRIFKFGVACQMSGARNDTGSDDKGWPHIEFQCDGENLRLPLCDALEALQEVAMNYLATRFSFAILTEIISTEDFSEAVLHICMHDAFVLGFAMHELVEPDFSGVPNILEELSGRNR
ncbi:hypothetical protein AC477_00110 [miscellaneous Crenarchaeota group-1 archaeon SG8-32-1]|uniref:Uncharacterized protein n=1 Tax=miscellaneous Crenarchaeota group-1 archaeon SG8-32-1 TaxID=1685124 RepID=A0A0M0C1G4_9ARCH|nr:MAG: hypothetical protein AC477_00110 [miscellaneous Crenarchaeota group-1 archaeon SG8-32-1]